MTAPTDDDHDTDDHDDSDRALLTAWRRTASRPVTDCRVFQVRADRYRHPRTDQERDFFVIDSPDWVNVIALTSNALTDTALTGNTEVVLVRQFRHGSGDVTLEIPGGMLEPDEDPVTAARRELREETGYEGAAATVLGWCQPNPALQGNRCYTVLIEGARQVAAQDPDPDEVLVVERRALDQIPHLIDDGTIRHSLVIAAFHRFDRQRR